MLDKNNLHIAVIGLGYVGLPLAIEFGKKYPTIGFDINQTRIDELESGKDSTLESSDEEITAAVHLKYTSNKDDLKPANIYIVTVPTPIDSNNQPETTALEKSSETISKNMSKGDIVIYESTVYPGMTREVCVPILEQSGLVFNKDFFVGYSPERINPGDKVHHLTKITKVTAGSTPETAETVDQLYKDIIEAGTYKASTIEAAEAAKVIENTQRDLNIALINEFALIFNSLGIDTEEVLLAAGTKWNFLPFRPGLVGGHCISVDPYYLTHKAEKSGYHPELILSGRRINSLMGKHVATQVIKLMVKKSISVTNSKILLMGFGFKENCPDIRNTRVVDIIKELSDYDVNVDIYDPWVDSSESEHEYGMSMTENLSNDSYDAVIVAVAHDKFKDMGIDAIKQLGKENSVVYDVKYLFQSSDVDGRL